MQKLKLSVMTGKLEGFLAINTNPLSNPWCMAMSQKEGAVCKSCYSRKMLKTYRSSCVPAFNHNANILSSPMQSEQYPAIPVGACIRVFAHGELADSQQLTNIINIARYYPNNRFVMWTKRVDILNKVFEFLAKPSNLRIIQSSICLNKRDDQNAHADAIFTVYDSADAMPADSVHCNGQDCAICMNCYDNDGYPVISELLRK